MYWEAWLLPFLLVARRERSPRPGARASPVTSTRSDVRVKPWIWQAGMRLPSCAKKYFLQNFVDSGNLIGENLHAVSRETLDEMRKAAQKHLQNVEVRGI